MRDRIGVGMIDEPRKIVIELDKEDLSEMIIVADLSLFESIRDDPDIDNIEWVAKRVKLIDKLMKANGEDGIL